ncbi:MAG: histidine phosphatase family protein [Acidimicrobiales bacterium]
MEADHVFLVRHGETALNAVGVLRGQLDVPLSATGQAEALALGELFRDVPLRAVMSSPLRRAADTARPLVLGSTALLGIDDRLRDRFYGEWAGHALAEVEERFGSIDAAPGVEEWQCVEDRAERAFLDVVAGVGAAAGGQVGVALVSHDAVLRALLGRLLPSVDLGSVELPTGSWSEIVAGPVAGWQALHLGQVPASGRRPDLRKGSGNLGDQPGNRRDPLC